MSNYTQVAWNPKERVARAAAFCDDYFGPHAYGVMFVGDPQVYRPAEVEIPVDLVLIPQGSIEEGQRPDTGLPQAQQQPDTKITGAQ